MATERRPISTNDFESGIFDLDGATEFKTILIYGDSGCGKTVLAGTVPGKSLFLAGEPGYISAARRGAQGKARLIPDTATATAAAIWLEDGHASEFDWVVVDGLSTMNNKFLLGYAAEAYDANPAKRAHRNLPDKPDYFNTQNFMKSWVARMIDLPTNVLFTAHSMHPEIAGDEHVYPAIQGKGYEISNYVCGLMHAVGFMEIKVDKNAEIHRRILWQRTERNEVTYFAKDQFDVLPRVTDDLDMPSILSIIDGREENKPAPATRRRTTK